MPANPKPSLDPGAISSLIRLRSMLARAMRDSEDPAEIGRHVTIVTLDAAVENAMRISAHHRGIPIRPDASFHDTLHKLQSAQLPWQPTGVRGVLELHAARNLAQHVGILPDRERAGGWAVEAEELIRGLVNAAFGTELDEVLLANAIRDPELRDLIARAEQALVTGDPASAFRLADTAFCNVRQRWHDRRQEINPQTRRVMNTLDGDPDPTSLNGAVDHQEVQVFATDMAPYTQLLVTRRHLSFGGPAPDVDEARSALIFVFDWILRWELFEAGYPADRYAEYWLGLGPPEDGGSPAIAWTLQPQRADPRPNWPEEYQLIVQFKNLPGRGRSDWGVDFQAALERAISELNLTERAAYQLSALSHGAMWIRVDQQLPPEMFATLLKRATELATDQFNKRQLNWHESLNQANELQAALREEIAAACTPGIVFHADATVDVELTPSGLIYRARIGLVDPTPVDLNLAWGGFSSTGGRLAAPMLEGHEVTFQLSDLTDEVREQFRETIIRTDDAIRRHRQEESDARVRLQTYADELATLLGEPPAAETR